ncbi:MAG: phosphopentomutase [Oscillospiraceae bacterium]|nr:phosphopentomutase [Oscillospiraceae bacterium]
MKIKRVFLIVLDSFGVGELPDAEKYGDKGSNTFKAVQKSIYLSLPNMRRLGLYNLADGVSKDKAAGAYGKLGEMSAGKDTTAGHWEIAGIITNAPMPTYPNGFPAEIISEIERATGRKVLCNRPYSGSKVINDYYEEQKKTGGLIVYTSADSVLQIAAHEDIIDVEELYWCCEKARKIMVGKNGVGRIIARPYIGEYPNCVRSERRKDFSLEPPEESMLDLLKKAGYDVIGVGKIGDIFAERGLTKSIKSHGNSECTQATFDMQKEDFNGLCFVNLVDFDMLYGHRNDIDGYARALSEFDSRLGEFLFDMKDEDVLIITADHGCDPESASTDHSREYVPVMVCGKAIKENVGIGTGKSMSDISATVLDMFGVSKNATDGESFWERIRI